MTTNTKKAIVLLILDIIVFVLGFGSFLFIVGTAGALEHDSITGLQYVVQSIVGFCGLLLAIGVYKVSEYLRRIFKNNKGNYKNSN